MGNKQLIIHQNKRERAKEREVEAARLTRAGLEVADLAWQQASEQHK